MKNYIILSSQKASLKPISMNCNFDYDSLKTDESDNYDIENQCRQIIGGITYAMLCTRPHLCSSIILLSKYRNCASGKLLIALKRVLRYTKGTVDLNLKVYE